MKLGKSAFAAIAAFACAVSATGANGQVVAIAADETSIEPQPPISEPLAPANAWVLDYAEDNCSLMRRFGTEERPVWFRIRKFSPASPAEFTVMGKGIDPATDDPVVAFFYPGSAVREVGQSFELKFPQGKGILYSARLNLAPISADEEIGSRAEWQRERERFEREAQIFELRGGLREPIALATGPMHEPLAALRTCTSDLLKSWGIDEVALANAHTQARVKNLEQWARSLSRRYPGSALIRGLQGTVPLLLIIDETGKIEKCIAQLPYKDETLETAACENMIKFAEFDPAIDAEGRPIKDYVPFSITYRLD